MPYPRQSQNKGTKFLKIFIVLSLLIASGFFVYYNTKVINPNVSASQFLNPFGEVKQSNLPNIPKVRGYDSIFYKIKELDLVSYVPLPVLSGLMGRENPFLKIRYYDEDVQDDVVETDEGNPEDATSTIIIPQEEISQGSK